MYTKIIIFALLVLASQATQILTSGNFTRQKSLPLCVWYRSAPLCGHGSDCPTIYPYLEYHASSSKNAQYCSSSFGSKCWSGEKNLCCNQDVDLQYTDSYTCGSY